MSETDDKAELSPAEIEFAQRMFERYEDGNIADLALEMRQIIKIARAALSRPQPSEVAELVYQERVEYETRVLAAEMRAERLKRLIPPPSGHGGYIGDTYFPVGGTEASHIWVGDKWCWHPDLESDAALRTAPDAQAARIKELERERDAALLAKGEALNAVDRIYGVAFNILKNAREQHHAD